MKIKKICNRAKRLAEIVVDYSISTKDGEKVLISGEVIALEFMQEIALNVLKKKAEPFIDITIPTLQKTMVDCLDLAVLSISPQYEQDQYSQFDSAIFIRGYEDPYYMAGVDKTKFDAMYKRFNTKLKYLLGDENLPNKKWCAVAFPTKGDAKVSGMNLKKWENFVYSATNIDWNLLSGRLNRIKDMFDDANDVHIIVPDQTDFHISLKGRGGQVSDGRFNMPDGEVFYGPVEYSAYGKIRLSYNGLSLTYDSGQLIGIVADDYSGYYNDIFDTPGADMLGEFGIGANRGIQNYVNNILFDEKIDGTIHIAAGKSYSFPLENGGGLNQSDIHQDLVAELRPINGNPGGKIYVDGNLVQEDGIWVFEK